MRILLLGGTGAMGLYLKEALLASGNDVYITSRKRHEGKGHLYYLKGDAHNFDFISSILHQRWDAIVDFMVYSTEEFQERVELMLNATAQYVFLSSSRVYANHDSPIKENSPRLLDCCEDKTYLSTDEYALKKAREESILLESGRKNFTIIRPYITYGQGRLQLEDLECNLWFSRALAGRTIVLSEDIANHYTTLTYGADVAAGIAAIIGNEDALGEIYHITSNEPILWKDVLEIYLKIIEKKIGFKPKVHWIKRSLKLNNKKTQYQILYDRLYDRVFDNSKIKSVATSLQFSSLQEGLEKSIEETLDSAGWNRFSPSKEAVFNRITKEHISLSSFPSLKQKVQYLYYRFISFDKWPC